MTVECCMELLLSCVDAQPDGVATIQQLREFCYAPPTLLLNTIEALIESNVLKRRDCYAYAVERKENTKSCYGEQPNFDCTIHLTRNDYRNWLNKSAVGNGLRLLVFDAKQRCVNSLLVASVADGDAYFAQWYDTRRFSHAFVERL